MLLWWQVRADERGDTCPGSTSGSVAADTDSGMRDHCRLQIKSKIKLVLCLQAKQRIVNLLGMSLGLGVFLVVALIVTQKQVAP